MTMTHPESDVAPTPPEHFRLSRHELRLIVAFWAVFAVLSIASRMVDRDHGGTVHVYGIVAVAVSEALCWMLLTPPLFILTGRLDASRRGSTQILVLAVIGIAVAALLGPFGTELRHTLTPFPSPAGPPPLADRALADSALADAGGQSLYVPRPEFRGPPVWYGVFNALVLYVGVVAAGLARTYSRRDHLRREQAARREARLEAQLAEARLEALRRQLDPHFLFNTLNAVSALVERDPRGVRRMIVRLSELLRHSFEGAGEAEVPLRAELALLERYVEIMQVRFQGRLTVTTRIDDRALDALVPSLILQPLVENAIKHGVERVTGPGVIDIEAELDGDELLLRVRDNGPGIRDTTDVAGRQGVGLRNTVARLEQLYGAADRFAIAASVSGGTVVELRLPHHLRPDAAPPPPRSVDDDGTTDAPRTRGGARVE